MTDTRKRTRRQIESALDTLAWVVGPTGLDVSGEDRDAVSRVRSLLWDEWDRREVR